MVTGGRLCPRLQSQGPAIRPQYDIDYSLKREIAERTASEKANDLSARVAHAGLADRYADRAWTVRAARCSDSRLKC